MKQYELTSPIKAARILALLAKPMTVAELAAEMHMSHQGMAYWIRDKLRAQIHIVEYRRGLVPIYMAGKRRDAKKPQNLTNEQIWARYKKKLREDLDRHDRRNAKGRALYHARKATAKPQQWFAALEIAA